MDLTKMMRSSAPFFSSARRRLLCSVQPHTQPQPQPQPLDQSFVKRVSSVLSNPCLDSTKSRQILTQLSPCQFDHLFCAIKWFVNPRTALGFFKFGAASCRYPFSIKSYCLLIQLLLAEGLTAQARLLFKKLILGEIPIPIPIVKNRHIEIAMALVNEKSIGVNTLDFFVHVCCTTDTEKEEGLCLASDVLRVVEGHGVLPSLKTCTFLLDKLVKVDDLIRGYEAFVIISRGLGLHHPDVYVYSAAIKLLFRFSRFNDAVGLFFKILKLGVSHHVVYNNIILGLCDRGDLARAFYFKERMVENGTKPNVVTYEILIQTLCRKGKLVAAHKMLQEMLDNTDAGYHSLIRGYHSVIDGYISGGRDREALNVTKLMLQNVPPSNMGKLTTMTYELSCFRDCNREHEAMSL